MKRHDALAILSSRLGAGSVSRRRLLGATAALGLGAAARPAPRATAQEEGAEVRFLVAEAFWADWHPYRHTAQIQRRIERQVFDSLIRVETPDAAAFSPGLAEFWQQVDELTWEFTLRQGVTYHNGQPFTAADVKAAIELASGATGEDVITASLVVPTTVEVVDSHTARLTTASPFAPLLVLLSTAPIVSAADVAAGGEALAAAPNGTGPFRLVDDTNNVKTMEANPDYWGGAPAITTLVWEYIQDSQTRLNALLAGQVQAIDRVPPEHLPVLEESPEVALLSTTGLEVVNLLIRQDAPPPWDDPRLRQAVAWSIDREALVESLVGGASQVAGSHIPNLALYAAPQEPAYTFDPERARALLAEAGFDDEGPEIDLRGTTGFLPRSGEVVQAIADSLQQSGFRPQVTLSDVAGIIDALATGAGLMFHLSWSSNGDPHDALNFLYHSSPDNQLGVDYPVVDELIERGATTTDPAAREQVYAELLAFLWENVVNLPLYNSDFTIAHLATLEGVVALPNFMTYFHKARLAAG